jgi:LysM repeat protein
MYLNQIFSASRAGLGCAGLSLLLILSGCASRSAPMHDTPTAAAVPVTTDGAQSAAEQPQTDTEVLAEAGAGADEGTTTVMADAGSALKPTAPKDYVVRRGDTLWGIANTFLRDPWQWPEIWYVNPKIANPHRIYPGDSVHLALTGDGRTALQVVRGAGLPAGRLEPLLRSSPLESAIPTLPYGVIAAFLGRPGVLSREEVSSAPYVLALRGEHDVAGAGDDVYVRKLDAQAAGARYSVMHVDQPLVDPSRGRKLGYLAIYTGTAELTRPGAVAKATLMDSSRETLQGDVLVPATANVTGDFQPHPPAHPVSGEIIAVVEGADYAGQYDVVAIDRGSGDGLERGNVLTVEDAGAVSDDQCATIEDHSTCLLHPNVALPTETAGTLLVFKTYEQMSYALILNETIPVTTLMHVRSP